MDISIRFAYIDMQNNLLIYERDLTSIEKDTNTVELSFPHKALIVSNIEFISEMTNFYFPWSFMNQYEKILISNIAYSGLKIPSNSFREENKIYYLDFRIE